MSETKNKKKKFFYINMLFALVCASLLTFLFMAPEETTSVLPHDEVHEQFYGIKDKKEAEAKCTVCHSESGESPLSEDHLSSSARAP